MFIWLQLLSQFQSQKKLGLGSVLGYLIAGVLIGPFVFGLIGEEGQDVMHFAEFGVVMMLFLIGLELKPLVLWKMRSSILGLGGVQVVLTAIIITVISILVSPLPWQPSLAIGLTLALSSTAIVLQTLNEKGLLKTQAGQNAFSVLLFQDIAVIPILAFLPLLALNTAENLSVHDSNTWIEGFPIILQTIIILGVITLIIISGKYLISPVFRLIAQTRLRELFTAAALLLVIAITLLMTKVGLSPALGTFLAGVVLAQNEYRHELETNIEPFKGLLLGLFFIAVGASVDFQLIFANPLLIVKIVLALLIIKWVVLFIVGKVYGMRMDSNMFFAFSLAQGGEFAFLLFSFALQNGVLNAETVKPLIAAVAISMTLTPILIVLNEKLVQPYFGTKEKDTRDADFIDEKNKIIIAGFGRYGSTIGRFLRANGQNATYLDLDPNNVDLLRKLGFKVFYGDASRRDLLHAAGAEEASLLIVAVDDARKALEIIDTTKKYFPNLKIMARSISWDDHYEMVEKQIHGSYREFVDTSLRMAADALILIGYRSFQVHRALKKFRKHDEFFIRQLAHSSHEHTAYIKHSKQIIEDLEKMILDDIENEAKDKELGWDSFSRRQEFISRRKSTNE